MIVFTLSCSRDFHIVSSRWVPVRFSHGGYGRRRFIKIDFFS